MSRKYKFWTAECELQLAELYYQMLPPSQIGRALGTTAAAVDSRVRKLGLKRPHKSPSVAVPDDFDVRARTMNVSKLMEHYGRARSVILRWMRERQIERQPDLGKRGKSVPLRFVQMAEKMTRADLARLYNTDLRTVRGWVEETGVVPLTQKQKRDNEPRKLEEESIQKAVVPRREFKSHTKLIAADAAHHLRRTHQCVHRADIQMYEQSSHTWGDVNDVPHRGVNQYFVSGKGVMWLDDLIAYAKTKGFTVKELI